MRCGPVILSLFLLCCSSVYPLQYVGGASHVLFGDLKFADTPEKLHQVSGLRVLLKSLSGQILRQQAVGIQGRFRFNEVPNGEYTLVVEANGRERVRVPLFINEFRSTDLRYDLELTWDDQGLHQAEDVPHSAEAFYARNPANQALFEQAQIEFEQNRLSKAKHILEELLKNDPDDYEAWTQLGSVQFRQEQKGPAAGSYQKALRLNPDFVPALFNLGKLEMLNRNYDRVIEHLSRAVLFDPTLAEAYYFLGEAHLQIQQGSKAVDYFRRAIELEPEKMADGHLRMAALYYAAGYTQLVVEEYREYLAKRPDSPQRPALEKYIAAHQESP